MELTQKIQDEIWEYCRLNKITDIDGFIEGMVQQGFTVEKYGATPTEKIVEKIVDKIIEVEKIVEKPVEIIKEVEKIVEREVYITDNEASKELTDKITKLEGDVSALRRAEAVQVNLVRSVSEERDKLKIEIDRLSKELATEKSKNNNEKKDIYGEGKKGFLGSNIIDSWKKKK